jgi:hypothetical protein
MIVGFPPFFGESPTETCKKIMNWRQYLKFPSDCVISEEGKDLIKRLVTDIDKRIGYDSVVEIKEHLFFKGIDWENLKNTKPVFIPEVNSRLDTKYFDKFEEEEPFYPSKNEVSKQISKDICFVDFDFERSEKERFSLVDMLGNEEFIKESVTEVWNKNKESGVLKGSVCVESGNLKRHMFGCCESSSHNQTQSHIQKSLLYKIPSESSIYKNNNNAVSVMKSVSNKHSSISIKVSIRLIIMIYIYIHIYPYQSILST